LLQSQLPSSPRITRTQVLVKNTHISIDPTHRIWMSDTPQYMPCVEVGECMRALTAGIVEESKFEGISKGDLVRYKPLTLLRTPRVSSAAY
jgi:NADPH-dependent curcumin reductase CurA